MKYQVLRLDTLTELVEAVNAEIAIGWLPLGGVAISNWFESEPEDRHGSTRTATLCEYAQAMVKE